MSAQNLTFQNPPAGLGAPARTLGSHYGTAGGMNAFARETSPANWQVRVYDPTSPLAVHDGWRTVGNGWLTLADACAATGLA